MLSLSYTEFICPIIKSIQELNDKLLNLNIPFKNE